MRAGLATAISRCRISAATGSNLEPLAADRGDAFERAAGLAGDDFEKALGILPRYRVFVDDVQRVMRLLHMQPRQGPPRAADQIQRLARGGRRSTDTSADSRARQ